MMRFHHWLVGLCLLHITLPYDKWDCLLTNATRRLHIGILVDSGFSDVVGSAQTPLYIKGLVQQANILLTGQMGLVLTVKKIKYATTQDSWDFNPSRGCPTISEAATLLTQWRAQTQSPRIAFWHLLTNCFPSPGLVGYSFTGRVCDNSQYTISLSSYNARQWETFTHEIGHMLGALDTSGVGGIMDDQISLFDGLHQFSDVSRAQICPRLDFLAQYEPDRWKACSSSFTPTCGDLVTEGQEECDDGPKGSGCCRPNCRLRKNRTCFDPLAPFLPNDCCVNCQALTIPTTCLQSQGYCSNGLCVSNPCSSYSLDWCFPVVDDPCKSQCSNRNQHTCTNLSLWVDPTTGRAPNLNIVDGTTCGIGVCRNGVCT